MLGSFSFKYPPCVWPFLARQYTHGALNSFMEQPIRPAKVFNIVIVAHRGRLSFEATLFALSLRHTNPDFAGRFFVETPAHNPLWPQDPSLP